MQKAQNSNAELLAGRKAAAPTAEMKEKTSKVSNLPLLVAITDYCDSSPSSQSSSRPMTLLRAGHHFFPCFRNDVCFLRFPLCMFDMTQAVGTSPGQALMVQTLGILRQTL